MKRRKILFLVAGIIAFAVILALFILWIAEHHNRSEPKTIDEVATELEQITETSTEQQSTAETEDEEKCMIYDLGYLYDYPQDEDAFKEQLLTFARENNIKTNEFQMLSKYENDRFSDEGMAYFYVQAQDEDLTVIQIIFDKASQKYSFAKYDDVIENIEQYGGRTSLEDERQYLSSEEDQSNDEIAPDSSVIFLYDIDDEMEKATDIEILKASLLLFLETNDETRRNLYVKSFDKTDTGFEAVLEFEHPRSDGKDVAVSYTKKDGYTFALRNIS